MQYDQVANVAISVAQSAALLVIVSVGLAVIFGLMRVINLAHGEFLMLGAFATLSCDKAGINVWASMVIASLAVGLSGSISMVISTERATFAMEAITRRSNSLKS